MSDQPIFHALLPSMTALKMWGAVELLIGYDSDDPLWSQAQAREQVGPVRWIELHAMRGNITAIFNWLAREADAYFTIPANDDLAFQTSPLTAVRTLKDRHGFGTVAFHDEAFPGLPTFYMVGRWHVDIFGVLYPLPWPGAHQDSWIADVYRPWQASEIDPSIRVHNRIGVGAARFNYGEPQGYREVVMHGRRTVRDWRREHISDDELAAFPLCIQT